MSEAIHRIMVDPNLIAVLPPRQVVILNPAGKLVYAHKPQVYVRLSAADVLSVVWETHYPAELQAMAGVAEPE